MDEYEEWEKVVADHWCQDLLDTPGALVSVIETKISRAVLHERRRIVDLLLEGDFVCRAKTPDSGLFAVFHYLVNNADWLSNKDIEVLHNRVVDAVSLEEDDE